MGELIKITGGGNKPTKKKKVKHSDDDLQNEFIESIETILELAKNGEIIGMAPVIFYKDPSVVGTGCLGTILNDVHKALGGCLQLQDELMTQLKENYEMEEDV